MKRIRSAIVPLIVLGTGVTAASLMYINRPQASQVEFETPQTHVEIRTVAPQTHRPLIRAMGQVQAERQVALVPEVAGTVVEQNAALVQGGRLAAGDPLLRVDPRDYSAAVAAGKADLAQAKLMVREENTLKKVAEHEWRERPKGFSEETLEFALREPHLDAAKARVSSAKSRIAKAKRDLTRTILRAPFDGIVLSESVEVGQMVGPNAPIVTIAGVDRYMVKISMPVADLRFVAVPGVNTEVTRGSAVTVFNEAAGTGATREGYVVRVDGSVDPRGRMAQIFVAVDDPIERLKPVAERGLPLFLGTYVSVEIEGQPIEDVTVLPRSALRPNGTVWVLDGEDLLREREVEILRREKGRLLIGDGLAEGERVVTTRLSTATEGLPVTVDGEDES